MTFFADWPYPIAVVSLFVIVMARANGTYWLGRGLRSGAGRTRVARVLDSPGYQRAERLVQRWGAPAVAVCFLTIGLQTLINIAAGATRMPLRRYLPAVTIGCVIWAFVYATVGFVTFEALLVLYRASPVGFWLLIAAVAATVATVVVINLRRRRQEPALPDDQC